MYLATHGLDRIDDDRHGASVVVFRKILKRLGREIDRQRERKKEKKKHREEKKREINE